MGAFHAVLIKRAALASRVAQQSKMATLNTYFFTHVKLCNELFFYKCNSNHACVLALDNAGKRLFVSAPFVLDEGNFSVLTCDIKLTAKKAKCTVRVQNGSIQFDDTAPVEISRDFEETLVTLFD